VPSLRKRARVVWKLGPKLSQQKDQLWNKATRQLQNQLPHLKHLLGVQVRTKQKMQERFETRHQLHRWST
jgi:hypothetical protein